MRKKTKKIKIKFTNSKLNKKIILFAAVLIIVAALFAPKLIDFIGVTGKVTGWEFHNKGEIVCDLGYYVAGWGTAGYHVDEYECVNYQGLEPTGTQTWVYIWNNAISPGGGGVYCPLGRYVTGWNDQNSDWREDEFQCSKPSGVDLMPTNCIWKHLQEDDRVSCPSGQIVTGWNDQNGNWWQDLFYCCTPTPSDPISEGTWLDVREGTSQGCSTGDYVTGWKDYLPVIDNWAHGDEVQDQFECDGLDGLAPTVQTWVNVVQDKTTYCTDGYAVTEWYDSTGKDKIIDKFLCSKPDGVDLEKGDCTWEPIVLGGKVHCLENRYVTGWKDNEENIVHKILIGDKIIDEFQCCSLTPVPLPTETCDGTDDDGDGTVDEGCKWCCDDDDGDGYVGATNYQFAFTCTQADTAGYETECSQLSTAKGGGSCTGLNGFGAIVSCPEEENLADDQDDSVYPVPPVCSDYIDESECITEDCLWNSATLTCLEYCSNHLICQDTYGIANPWCDLTTGKCVECLTGYCPTGEVCDLSLHECKPECDPTDDPTTCADPTPVCGPSNFCVECTSTGDCDTGEVCDTNTYTCKPTCGSPGDCLLKIAAGEVDPGLIICGSNAFCVECTSDVDCDTAAGQGCDTTTNTCIFLETVCIEDWSCTSWSACVAGEQTRTCTDSNDCETEVSKPAETQSCTIGVAGEPSLTYEDITTIGTYNLHKWTFDGGQRTIYYPAATATESELTLVYQGTSYLMGKDYHYWKIQGTTKGMLAEQGGS